MPVSFTLTEDDFMLAVQLHQRELRDWRWTAAGLVLLNGGLYFLRIIDGHWEFLLFMLCPFSVIAVLFAVALFVVGPYLNRQRFRQMKEVAGPQTVEITPEGLHTTMAMGQTLRPWSYFGQWKESELLFLLYLNNMQFVLLPKRAFADPAPLAALRGYLNAQPRAQAKAPLLKLFFGVLIAGLAVGLLIQLVLLFR